MLEYNKAQFERGQAVIKSLTKKTPDHPELPFVIAEQAALGTKIAQLEAFRSQANQTPAETPAPSVAPYERILSSLRLDPEQLAQHPSQITPDTKAYVGSFLHHDDQGRLMPIFRQLAAVEHIYNAEGKEIPTWILRRRGFKNTAEFERALDEAKIHVTPYALSMLRNKVFAQSIRNNPQNGDIRVGLLDGYDTGYPVDATTTQRFNRGPELGLEEMFPTDAVYQRLQDLDQQMDTYYANAMPRITDSGGGPSVFGSERGGDGLWLGGHWAGPGGRWDPEARVLWRFPQVELQAA